MDPNWLGVCIKWELQESQGIEITNKKIKVKMGGVNNVIKSLAGVHQINFNGNFQEPGPWSSLWIPFPCVFIADIGWIREFITPKVFQYTILCLDSILHQTSPSALPIVTSQPLHTKAKQPQHRAMTQLPKMRSASVCRSQSHFKAYLQLRENWCQFWLIMTWCGRGIFQRRWDQYTSIFLQSKSDTCPLILLSSLEPERACDYGQSNAVWLPRFC